MRFEWDRDKARKNREKHGVDFADAAGVFEDEQALTLDDRTLDEDRHVTIGADPLGRVIIVAYPSRRDSIRIISARRATRRERLRYEAKR